MVYVDTNKEFREWQKLSEEQIRKKMGSKSCEFYDFLYKTFLPDLEKCEKIAREKRIFVTNCLDLKVA